MDKDDKKNVRLVSREDNERFLGTEKKPDNEREIQFLNRKKEREKNRKFRLDKEMARKIIAISMVGALAASIIGKVNSGKNTNINQDEREYISQDINYGAYTNEENPYAPDNLVFDEVVHSYVNEIDYRLVVNKQNECSFVNMDYSCPFQILDEINCYDAARNLGYDFDSLSEGRSR